MTGRIALLGAAILAAAATSASAQQTQTYAYDVHGRLTGVTRTTGSTSQTTTYVLDKADNRTSRATGASTTTLTTADVASAFAISADSAGNVEVKTAADRKTEAPSPSPDVSGSAL